MSEFITVVGGGLAGCEAAIQLARRGRRVRLFEMRPEVKTAAHQTEALGELVCTNSFKTEDPSNAHGQLKREMAALGSILLENAQVARVPAGSALAVDRHRFAEGMTATVESFPNIEIVRAQCTGLPEGPAIIATGPLTSESLSQAILDHLGGGGLSFFDAIAPIVHRDSLDESIVFAQGRFEESSDYLNCPMSKDEYEAFIDGLIAGDVHEGHDWDNVPYFEGCLPIEVMASRGRETLRFGPMKPIGLTDPRTDRRPWAVVQLRREDAAGQMLNLVGFQTRLKIGAQKAVFRAIPGLADAEFLRWGSIHRNSYLNAPEFLSEYQSLRDRPDLLIAGQLTGVEGYTESAASGIMAGINLDRLLDGKAPVVPPPTTMIGGLYRYLNDADPSRFQPMNSNWGLVDPLENPPRKKIEKRAALGARAQGEFLAWMERVGIVQPALADAGPT